jgi:hypothetical protein
MQGTSEGQQQHIGRGQAAGGSFQIVAELERQEHVLSYKLRIKHSIYEHG